jgi:hypothetical protein
LQALIKSILAPLDECLQVGAAIRLCAEKTGQRFAVVGSTGFAHKIERGMEKWPSKEIMEFDREYIELLTAGGIKEAKQRLPESGKQLMMKPAAISMPRCWATWMRRGSATRASSTAPMGSIPRAAMRRSASARFPEPVC